MNFLIPDELMPATGLEVNTGMPLYFLMPIIMIITIATVIGIRWFYKKVNK